MNGGKPGLSLFRHGAVLFLLMALILFGCFGLASYWLGTKPAGAYSDKKALAALKSLEKAVRPLNQVRQPAKKLEDVAEILGCPKEGNRIFGYFNALDARLLVDASGTPLALDLAAWNDGGKTRDYGCADLERGLAFLMRDEGRALDGLIWRGRTLNKLPADQWVQVPDQILTRPNPWGGLPGCILMGGGAESKNPGYYLAGGRNDYCKYALSLQGRKAVDKSKDGALMVPESLETMLADVNTLRLPGSDSYRLITDSDGAHGPNRINPEVKPPVTAAGASANGAGPGAAAPTVAADQDVARKDVGFHVLLSVNPQSQQIAQAAALCYTGHGKFCESDGSGAPGTGKAAEVGAEFFEQAAVRMTGIAIIDLSSGRIEALASAETDCFRRQYGGSGVKAGHDCPNVPRALRFNPDMLLNHALFSDAMPASTIKPILALGFLETAGYVIDDAQLTQQLKTSDSAAFLSRLFCLDSAGGACPRLANVQAAARQLGWNPGCAEGSVDCGFVNILFGRRAEERLNSEQGKVRYLESRVLFGRLFTAPVSDKERQLKRLMSAKEMGFTRADAQACKAQGWRKCVGNPVANPASEGWGQGNARSTALGVAGMFARLGAMSQGQTKLPLPYLVEAVVDARGQPLILPALKRGEAEQVQDPALQQAARRVVEGLRQGHRRGGTAGEACRNAGLGDCETVDWIAGKTGTPPFGYDQSTLTQIAQLCGKIDAKNAVSCRQEIPYKWYAALFKSRPDAPDFDKAIAVLSERNWYAKPARRELAGKVDAPGDHGPNRSAEIAFKIMAGVRAARNP